MSRHQAQQSIIGVEGQKRIAEARVLIVGVGALGSVAGELLCRAGVRNITLCDYDFVEESNLQRQGLYTTDDLGRLKVEAAKEHLIAIDPLCLVTTIAAPFSTEVSLTSIDLIIDGTDSLQARLLVNDAAKKAGIPLVVASVSGTQGLIFVSGERVCWQCIVEGKAAVDDCDSSVLGTATHAIASMQANASLQAILSSSSPYLLSFDIWNAELRKIEVKRNKICAACNGNYKYLDAPFTLEFCEAKGKLQTRPSKPMVLDLEKLRHEEQVEHVYESALLLKLDEGNVLVHRFGTLEFKNVDPEKAHRFSDHLYKKMRTTNS